mmetsp:Transcript_31067/g.72251  ORF Transcript_31067/g.72251 Transcript_31067/m.72251 type:complete len:260 (+) Transcript_31067:279-1058(+)
MCLLSGTIVMIMTLWAFWKLAVRAVRAPPRQERAGSRFETGSPHKLISDASVIASSEAAERVSGTGEKGFFEEASSAASIRIELAMLSSLAFAEVERVSGAPARSTFAGELGGRVSVLGCGCLCFEIPLRWFGTALLGVLEAGEGSCACLRGFARRRPGVTVVQPSSASSTVSLSGTATSSACGVQEALSWGCSGRLDSLGERLSSPAGDARFFADAAAPGLAEQGASAAEARARSLSRFASMPASWASPTARALRLRK